MLARVNGVYSNPPVLQNISGGKMAVPADVSQLTCATAASDGERRKVLPCFSRAGHRPKVGHKSFAHAHNLLKKHYMFVKVVLIASWKKLLRKQRDI